MVEGKAKGYVFMFKVWFLVLVMLVGSGLWDARANSISMIDSGIGPITWEVWETKANRWDKTDRWDTSSWNVKDSSWIEPYLEYFVWREFDGSGKEFVRESGLRVGAGLAGHKTKEVLGMEFIGFYSAYGFIGGAGYEGHTWGGEPIKSSSGYFGGKGSIEVGIKRLIFYGFLPYVGTDYKFWIREIEGREGVYGYREMWRMMTYKVGVKRKIERIRGDLTVDLWIGSDIFTGNKAMFSRSIPFSSDVLVFPDGSIFFGAEASYRVSDRILAKVYYNRFKWNASEPEVGVILGYYVAVYQPESTENTLGFSIGIRF